MWAEADESVEVISPAELVEEMKGDGLLLLDVRLPQEIKRRGFIAGSKPVPRQVVEWWADPESPYFRPDGEFGVFARRLITYCDGGGNGALTAATLQDLGYTNVATVEGGFFGWLAAGLPIVDPPD